MINKKFGVILANLGTPDAPTPAAISRYLWEFLTDQRVVDLPKWKWLPLLKTIILPLRSKRIAKNYQAIWGEQGSPLLTITQAQQFALQRHLFELGVNAQVEMAMTYGAPSMQNAIEKLTQAQVEKIVILPLYPQYSSSTTGALFDVFAQALKTQRRLVPFEWIHSYHLDEFYLTALTNSIQTQLKSDEFLLFSYHGIPLRYEQMGDYYRTQCQETTFAIVKKLGLQDQQWAMTFQSRFGREEWLTPYTDEFMQQAAQKGIKKIAVVCPGFSADCLETLEEIEHENRDIFLENGGETYQYIPALNAQKNHIEMMGKLILAKIR